MSYISDSFGVLKKKKVFKVQNSLIFIRKTCQKIHTIIFPNFGHFFAFAAFFLWQKIFLQTLLGALNMGEGPSDLNHQI